jgi:hypothetical protein
MDPDAPFLIAALLTVSGAVLVGLRMFLSYRLRRFQAEGGGAPSRELEEAVGELRDQMYLLRGDVTDLQERLEFTERVLARGPDEARLPDGH